MISRLVGVGGFKISGTTALSVVMDVSVSVYGGAAATIPAAVAAAPAAVMSLSVSPDKSTI